MADENQNGMDRTQKLKGPISFNKSVPSVCSQCNRIYKINTWVIEDGKKTGVSHGLCKKCYLKMKDELEKEK